MKKVLIFLALIFASLFVVGCDNQQITCGSGETLVDNVCIPQTTVTTSEPTSDQFTTNNTTIENRRTTTSEMTTELTAIPTTEIVTTEDTSPINGYGNILQYYGGTTESLTVWVENGTEDFYQAMANNYIDNIGGDYPFLINVVAKDISSSYRDFLNDMENGPDIFATYHSEIEKLTTGTSAIAPISGSVLTNQVILDNYDTVVDNASSEVYGTEYLFGIPYSMQSSVLFYNTRFVSETQVQTWEGLLEAARAADAQALSLVGTDGYNNSFLLLSNRVSDHSSTLQLYEDGVQENCLATGDDTVAVMKWGQRFFNDPNGAKRPTLSGWEVELMDDGVNTPTSLSVIGSVWNYDAAQAVLGENLGIASLPTFTLTAEDAYGTATEGTVYKSGSFTDIKMFVMKKNTEYSMYLEDLLLYFSNKEVQEHAFNSIGVFPSYKNATTEFFGFDSTTSEGQLALSQSEMLEWGLLQPFGFSIVFNFYYYSKGGPDYLLEILENPNTDINTLEEIKARLLIIETIWKTGSPPTN